MIKGGLRKILSVRKTLSVQSIPINLINSYLNSNKKCKFLARIRSISAKNDYLCNLIGIERALLGYAMKSTPFRGLKVFENERFRELQKKII
ncbi:hypothetical protein C7Y71_003395 [Pseudoprevotella muciniphila]|uniref:Uncharacterized protein n=1 Tax=Pseudoprevotella muciniphila TaxID=2133944 RepID=A0A5P8E5A2_9BACT|nr:hypothetical protein C7Y71_003395 [Pseudoprevotella muciniphila]